MHSQNNYFQQSHYLLDPPNDNHNDLMGGDDELCEPNLVLPRSIPQDFESRLRLHVEANNNQVPVVPQHDHHLSASPGMLLLLHKPQLGVQNTDFVGMNMALPIPAVPNVQALQQMNVNAINGGEMASRQLRMPTNLVQNELGTNAIPQLEQPASTIQPPQQPLTDDYLQQLFGINGVINEQQQLLIDSTASAIRNTSALLNQQIQQQQQQQQQVAQQQMQQQTELVPQPQLDCSQIPQTQPIYIQQQQPQPNNVMMEPLVSGYQKYLNQTEEQSPSLAFLQAKQNFSTQPVEFGSNAMQQKQKAIGQQVMENYQQIAQMNSRQKAEHDTNSAMALDQFNKELDNIFHHQNEVNNQMDTRSNRSAMARLRSESVKGGENLSDYASRPRRPAGYRKSHEMSYDVSKRRMSMPVQRGMNKVNATRTTGSKFNQRETSHSSKMSLSGGSSQSSRSSKSMRIKKKAKQQPFPNRPQVMQKKSQFMKAGVEMMEEESSGSDCSNNDSCKISSGNVLPESSGEYMEESQQVRYIGPLTSEQRLEKVRKYWRKKHNKANSQKHHYVCRQQVAEKRLRIKGRFVTKEQAYAILNLTPSELLDNMRIQDMLTAVAASGNFQIDSLIAGIKVRNLHTLIEPNQKQQKLEQPVVLSPIGSSKQSMNTIMQM